MHFHTMIIFSNCSKGVAIWNSKQFSTANQAISTTKAYKKQLQHILLNEYNLIDEHFAFEVKELQY
jgi:hypothetical protein